MRRFEALPHEWVRCHAGRIALGECQETATLGVSVDVPGSVHPDRWALCPAHADELEAIMLKARQA